MINRIEYSIIDQCNLNCAYCSHYASIVMPYKVTLEQFEKDMKRLSELTNEGRELGTIGILGGEPLLHKDFIELCILARKYLPYSRVRVTTNGLLLNKLTGQQLGILRRFDIEFLISKYRETDDFAEIERILNEYHLVWKWCQHGELVTFTKYRYYPESKYDANENHKKCQIWQQYYTCHELRDGYLHVCTQTARVESVNKAFNINLPTCGNSMYIHTDGLTLECIEKFLKEPVPMCEYCNVDEFDTAVGKWRKSTKQRVECICDEGEADEQSNKSVDC